MAMIVSQICETMTEMSWRARLLPLVGAAALLTLAGCCGSGSTHKCDFTPATSGTDAGASDGGIPCPSMPCVLPQVCCVTKAPANIACVDVKDFMNDHCEMLNTNSPPPCSGPGDCLNGNVCCYQSTANLISCQKDMVCPGDGSDNYVVCSMDSDCPATTSGSCMIYGTNPATGLPFGYCRPSATTTSP